MIQDLKPYPAYKSSGVPWLGKVPEHWEVRRLKYLLRELDTRSVDGCEQLLRVSQYTGVTQRVREDGADELETRADSLVGYRCVQANDLVVNIMLAWNGSMGVSQFGGIASPAYCVYRFRAGTHPWYFHHLLRSPTYKARIKAVSTGVVESRLRLYTDDLYRLQALLPPLPEQAAIVCFLDYADRRIRRYIRVKQQLIKLLEEQKQAIIHRAVTRSLDPYVRLKPSGVEWLGDVPEHWRVFRLKFVAANLVDCLHATPRYSDNGLFPAIRTADISPGTVHLGSARKIDADEYIQWTERLEPKPGDILYSREGERFGIAACVPEGTRLCISQRMMVFRIRPEHNPVFVMWLLNSKHVYAQACQDVMGATAPHVNVATIRNYYFPLPPRDEQDSLVAWISFSTKGISGATSNAMDEISVLREYRTRLIADVVTGKLDVREAAAQLAEEPEETEPVEDMETLTEDDESDEAADFDPEEQAEA